MEHEERQLVLMGNLNEIISDEEKRGGRPCNYRRLFLINFMQKIRAIDLGFSGNKFKWDNKHGNRTNITEMLDWGSGQPKLGSALQQGSSETSPKGSLRSCPYSSSYNW